MKTDYRIRTERDVYSKKSKSGIALLKENHACIFTLNPAGEFLWKLCRHPISVSSLVKKLTGSYGVSEVMAHHDVSEFIKQCLHEGIMRRVY